MVSCHYPGLIVKSQCFGGWCFVLLHEKAGVIWRALWNELGSITEPGTQLNNPRNNLHHPCLLHRSLPHTSLVTFRPDTFGWTKSAAEINEIAATGCMLLPAINKSFCWYINTATGWLMLPVPNTSFSWYINTAIGWLLLPVPNTSFCWYINTATACMLLPVPNTSSCWYINTATGCLLLPAQNASCCWYINTATGCMLLPHKTHRAVGTLIRLLAACYYPSQTHSSYMRSLPG